MFVRLSISLGLLLCLTGASGSAMAWFGEPVRVTGGERMSIRYSRTPAWVRLHGVDVPKSDRANAKRARERVRALVRGKLLRVRPAATRQRGIITAQVFVGRTCINRVLIREGLARWDRENAPDAQDLERLEQQARQARRGIWATATSNSMPAAVGGAARAPAVKPRPPGLLPRPAKPRSGAKRRAHHPTGRLPAGRQQ